MNELIDAGDPRTKVVGKRRPPEEGVTGSVAAFDRMQRQMTRLWGKLPFRTGVYRFSDREEFQTWKMTRMMRNSPARR